MNATYNNSPKTKNNLCKKIGKNDELDLGNIDSFRKQIFLSKFTIYNYNVFNIFLIYINKVFDIFYVF